MKLISYIFSNKSSWLILLVIALLIVIQRSPTLLIEFTNIDEISFFFQAKESLHEKQIFLDPLTCRIFTDAFIKLSLILFGDETTIGLHIGVILLILLTSFILYLIGTILLNRRTGFLAALFYGIFISGFTEQFLSLKAEIPLNFAFMLSFYFFLLYEVKKHENKLFLVISGIFLAMTALSKQQGMIFLFAYALYYFALKTFFYKESWKESFIRYLYIILGFTLVFILIFAYFYNDDRLYSYIYNYLLYYIFNYIPSDTHGHFQIGQFVWDFTRKMAFVVVSSFILWFLGFLCVKNEVFQKKDKNAQMILLFFLMAYSLFFAGLGRLFFHYLIPSLPFLSLLAAYYLAKNYESKFFKKPSEKWLNFAMLVPMIIYLSIYYTVITISWIKPELTEDRISGFITIRKDYRELADWLKKNTSHDDRIYLWGNLCEVYYFAKKRSPARYLWWHYILPDQDKVVDNNPILRKSSISEQNNLISDLKRMKIAYFIDGTTSPMITYPVPKLERFTLLNQYIKDNYKSQPIKVISGMKIYQRKKK